MNELYELLTQKEQTKALIKTLEEQIEETKKLIERLEKSEGKVYLLKGSVFLEASKEEVKKELEEKVKLLELQVERYKKRLELINEKIKQLR